MTRGTSFEKASLPNLPPRKGHSRAMAASGRLFGNSIKLLVCPGDCMAGTVLPEGARLPVSDLGAPTFYEGTVTK